MFVKDLQGNWYEVSEKALADKKVDPDKAREAVAAERAEKRKKVLKLLSSLDRDERTIVCQKVLCSAPGHLFPGRSQSGTRYPDDAIDCNGGTGEPEGRREIPR